MTPSHLDDFTLLRFVAKDLDDIEGATVRRHLRACTSCREGLKGIEALDDALRRAKSCLDSESGALAGLPPGDPFRFRPAGPVRARRAGGEDGPASVAAALAATRLAPALKERLLLSAGEGDGALRTELDRLLLGELAHRYALGYALDEAIARMVEAPARWLSLGDASADRVEREGKDRTRAVRLVERGYPLVDLLGLCRLVAGVARNWTGDLVRGGRDLSRAWRSFGHGSASESRLAQVELAESQRRTFLGRPAEGLVLAERSARSFEALGRAEQLARARGSRALALSYLDRDEEALIDFRAARDGYEEAGFWNGWVTALNGIGACLLRLGRLDEARREYARALKRVSKGERPSVHAFVRGNLARTLFEAGRYADAARAFAASAELFESLSATADSVGARLWEIESLARCGAWGRAGALMGVLRDDVEAREALDPDLLASLQAVLSGEVRDVDILATLRRRAEESLRRPGRATA